MKEDSMNEKNNNVRVRNEILSFEIKLIDRLTRKEFHNII